MEIEQNLMLLQELIRCGSDIYVWVYDGEGNLLRSNCPDEALFATAFSALGEKARMLEHSRASETPMILGNAIGMNWGVAYRWEAETLAGCYVIGPVFYYDVSMREVEQGLQSFPNLDVSVAWTAQFISALGRIPLAQSTILSRYTLMLHYCLTGQRLDASDLAMQSAASPQTEQRRHRDRHKIWLAEQAMLQMVRNGDLNYKEALNASILSSSGVPVRGKDPLRQAKTSGIVFTSIVCRAAIEGGLSPEEAYTLGDAYIQSIEAAERYDELSGIVMTMYDDFVRRVHRKRANPKYSPPDPAVLRLYRAAPGGEDSRRRPGGAGGLYGVLPDPQVQTGDRLLGEPVHQIRQNRAGQGAAPHFGGQRAGDRRAAGVWQPGLFQQGVRRGDRLHAGGVPRREGDRRGMSRLSPAPAPRRPSCRRCASEPPALRPWRCRPWSAWW